MTALVALSLVAMSAGAAAPSVSESTGDLGYSYEFVLPAARGRHQPALALSYSSASRSDAGFGYGWALNETYIETESVHTPGSRVKYRLVRGGKPRPLVRVSEDGTPLAVVADPLDETMLLIGDPEPFPDPDPPRDLYRQDVESDHLEIERIGLSDDCSAWFDALDAWGTRYSFRRIGASACGRWYLTVVTDVLGNETVYEYEPDLELGTGNKQAKSARLNRIRWNRSPSGTFVHDVELKYSANAAPLPGYEALRGSIADRRHRLTDVVVSGLGARVRAWRLTYVTAGTAAQSTLDSIIELGTTDSSAQPPTRFDYGLGGVAGFGWALEDGVQLAHVPLSGKPPPSCADLGTYTCSISEGGAWLDLDGDARPDLVWGGQNSRPTPTKGVYWARNVTTPGSATLAFEAPELIENTDPYFENTSVFGTGLKDFDGDGRLDQVNLRYAGCAANGTQMGIWFGRTVTEGHYRFENLVCVDISAALGNPASPNPLKIVDVNADGVLDLAYYTCATNPCGYKTYLGLVSIATTGLKSVVFPFSGYAQYIPGQAFPYALPGCYEYRDNSGLAADVNGDGVTDVVDVVDSTWTSVISSRNWTGTSKIAWGTGPAIGSTAEAEALCYSDSGQEYMATVKDQTRRLGNTADFNGDGRVDGLSVAGGAFMVRWNTGRGFAATSSVPLPKRAGVSSGLWPGMSRIWQGGNDCQQGCRWSLGVTGSRGDLIDLNADGVPDYVHVSRHTGSPTWWFYRGVQRVAGGAALDGGREILLRAVTTPFGATYRMEYAPATRFGASSPRPVVVRMRVEGRATASTLMPAETRYWYAGAVMRTAWYDPVRREDGGFAKFWSQDDVTRLVRHVQYRASEYVFSEVPQSEQLATELSPGTDTTPPQLKFVFKTTSTTLLAKRVSAAACLGATEPAPGEFPVRLVPYLVESGQHVGLGIYSNIKTRTECVDVDSYGNVMRSSSTPSLAGLAGRTVVKRAVRTGITSCPAVPATLAAETFEVTSAGEVLLAREVERFDASCRPIEKYAGPDTQKTNQTTFSYLGCRGQLDASISGGDAKRIVYEPQCLFPASETTEDAVQSQPGSISIATVFTWDVGRGLKTSERGPYVLKKDGASYAGRAAQGITRYWAYDGFGRVAAVAKAPPTGGSITAGVEAFVYLDDASQGPRSVRRHKFSVPTAFAVGNPPWTDDVEVTQTFHDELGRPFQSRERLGGGGAAHPDAKVIETVTGYLVSDVKVFDGAGRIVAALEPFYDDGSAFEDYRGGALRPRPETGPDGVRGTFASYDERGRPACSTYAWIPATADLRTWRPPGGCTSSSAHSDTFRLSTESRYGVRFEPGRGPFGGLFEAVETIPPELNLGGAPGAMPMAGPVTGRVVKLFGGAGEELGSIDGDGNYVWVERDGLGREIASWREARDRTLSTRRPPDGVWGGARSTTSPQAASWIAYNLAGQAVQSWDASSGLRTNSYDEAGRLTLTQVNGTADAMEYVFAAGSLGRATTVNEIVAGVRRLVARNRYDLPMNEADAGYAFTAGKLSWTDNAETQIAYGYDDGGRVARRDQWFKKIEATAPGSRFGMGTTYGVDGRVLRADHTKPGAGDPHAQLVYYDSAGRPVELRGQRGTGPISTYWKADRGTSVRGAYDALGRIPKLVADSGQVRSERIYDGYSGLLKEEWKAISSPTAFTIFKTIDAQYRADKIESFKDDDARADYANVYKPSGRLERTSATPRTGTVPGPVTQDYEHRFTFNGVGNVGTAVEERDRTPESAAQGKPRMTFARTYGYVKPSATEVDDKLERITTDRSRNGTPECSSAALYVYDPLGRLISRGADTCTGRPAETFGYDLQGHLVQVTRAGVVEEKLGYAPGGELAWRQAGDRLTFYAGEYATVSARADASGNALVGTVAADEHVVLAGTRIASVNATRVLYYYRTRLGTVIGTSLGGGRAGARYRYGPYGEPDKAANETDETRSELGYTNALTLSGGLVYLRARVYDTVSRTFLQADHVDRLRYAYVWGDPANLSDPTGLLPASWVTVGQSFLQAVMDHAQEAQAAIEAREQAKQAKQAPPRNEEQVSAESAKQEEKGVGLWAATKSAVTDYAKSRAQYFADYSVDPKNPAVGRAVASFFGTAWAGLDESRIAYTAPVVALTAGAAGVALATSGATGGAVAGAAATPAGQGAIATGALALGRAGEASAGIVKNTERIASATGTAAYRIPDALNHAAKVIGEVKNVASLPFTNQLRDFAAYAATKGYSFELTVRSTTRLSGPLQQAVATGTITLKTLP